jgi:hypothetical protein
MTSIDLRLDVVYEIKILMGDTSYDGQLSICIQGVQGRVSIPLRINRSGKKPFRARTGDEFVCKTTDVGRIKYVQIEHQGTHSENRLVLQKLHIIRDREVYW